MHGIQLFTKALIEGVSSLSPFQILGSALWIKRNPKPPIFYLLLLATQMKVNILRILLILLPFTVSAFNMFLSLLPAVVVVVSNYVLLFSAQFPYSIWRIGYLEKWKKKKKVVFLDKGLYLDICCSSKKSMLSLSLQHNFYIMMNLLCLLCLSNYCLSELSGCLCYHICWILRLCLLDKIENKDGSENEVTWKCCGRMCSFVSCGEDMLHFLNFNCLVLIRELGKVVKRWCGKVLSF